MTPPQLPDEILQMMADRNARMHHYLWHQVRNMWLSYDDPTKEAIRSLGWEPPRPARRPLPENRSEPIYDNGSGEDFLYMHRQMIDAVNTVLRDLALPDHPKVSGWNPIPRPDDVDYPVPPAWDSGNEDFNAYLQQVKSVEFFNTSFVGWETAYTDPNTLRQWTLGEFGARLEYTVHNQMHMRWCTQPAESRPDVDPTRPGDIDAKWDDPSYDWLGDTYSSHVNPIFWKLHGWVDDRIDDWRRAHGVDEVKWTGTWVGNMPHGHHLDDPHALLAAVPTTPTLAPHDLEHHQSGMERVLQVVLSSGTFGHFYDAIEL